MNLRFLQTVVAISEHPTFVAAARSLGLSDSAVSLQIKALEDELQLKILDRRTRPPSLTDAGHNLVERARHMLRIADDIRALADNETLSGRVTVGAVPSIMKHLLPPAIAEIRREHPELIIGVRTGLSGDLAQSVRDREVDLAIVTEPKDLPTEMHAELICREPLDVIAPSSAKIQRLRQFLISHPFIWFNRRTWVGRQAEEYLLDQKIYVHPIMEIDSIDAVESFVAHGLGISITPLRCKAPLNSALQRFPIGRPRLYRGLVMLQLANSPRPQVAKALLEKLRIVANDTTPCNKEPSERVIHRQTQE
jgi:DNA-binding transcriptional LysR family regulator